MPHFASLNHVNFSLADTTGAVNKTQKHQLKRQENHQQQANKHLKKGHIALRIFYSLSDNQRDDLQKPFTHSYIHNHPDRHIKSGENPQPSSQSSRHHCDLRQ